MSQKIHAFKGVSKILEPEEDLNFQDWKNELTGNDYDSLSVELDDEVELTDIFAS